MPSNHKAKSVPQQVQHTAVADKPTASKTTSQKRNRARTNTDSPTTAPSNKTWVRADLHVHTPASHDYEEPGVSYLDILRQAERRGVRILAFTDHNTVNGYRAMHEEIKQLEFLERLGRIHPEEQGRLNEYRRLLHKVLVLPGFEFTATFGFHVLGIFPPTMPLRDIERILMDLRVPSSVLDQGLTEAGATSDVLTAYKLIDESGGIVIAAHANSSNGVSMRGFNIGGQTRIAFTQDPHLHAIEFTDLDRGRHSSAQLFSGTRPEYPRRMFAVQGSDAHRLAASKSAPKRLGVGERCTEFLLEEVSFAALRQLLQSRLFDHVRPVFDVLDLPEDPLAAAQRDGPGLKVAFHPTLPRRSARLAATLQAVLCDLCGMANAEGGVIYIGCSANPNERAAGVDAPAQAIQALNEAIAARIQPALKPAITPRRVNATTVIELTVPAGDDAPYMLDGAFYIRDGATTRKATRDEIVAIARRGYVKAAQASTPSAHTPPKPKPQHPPAPKPKPAVPMPPAPKVERAPDNTPSPTPSQAEPAPSATPIEPPLLGAPRTGVQVVAHELRDGLHYFTIRDLRNNSIIRNVTHKSARDLWLYAIQRHLEPLDEAAIPWQGNRAVLSYEMRAGKMRADLAMRDAHGKVVVFYGVTEDGLDEAWRALLPSAPAPAPEVRAAESQLAPEAG
ncbi:MAG: putative DNA binding domain-containing protein [Anaerolineae bacterium]|nr:putative DNA binding domain-containing protein [Anaerolineae bacterium]